jgi:LacI family transcriptional regulator, galactose operon repressor
MPARPARRRITIKDVAAHCGVSTSAVSNVLRHAYGVSPEMQAKVETAIAELGYRPHAGARAMRGRTYTLGVLVADVHNAFLADLVDAIMGQIRDTEYQVILGPGGSRPDEQCRSIEAMVDRQVDGVVLIAPMMPQKWLEELATTVPTVVLGRHGRSPLYDTVVDDDLEGSRLVVDHLVDLGHRRIAHIAAGSGLRAPHALPQTVRADGYRRAMQQHGLESEIDVVTETYTEEGGYRGAIALLRRPRPPTAIFAGADIAALGVLRAVHEAGLTIPADLSLAAYDNTSVAAIPQIDLTSVDQAGQLTGRTAARLLMERIDGRTAPVLFSVAPRLVVRGSTAPLPGPPPSPIAGPG